MSAMTLGLGQVRESMGHMRDGGHDMLTVPLFLGMWVGMMVAIALVFLAEKNWQHGVGLLRVVGATLILVGVVIAALPALLPEVSRVGLWPSP